MLGNGIDQTSGVLSHNINDEEKMLITLTSGRTRRGEEGALDPRTQVPRSLWSMLSLFQLQPVHFKGLLGHIHDTIFFVTYELNQSLFSS
jgi:hypothetical protein